MKVIKKIISKDMILHCTKKEHIKWLIENGYAYKNMEDKPLPFWFHVRNGKSNDWMPEIKVVDESDCIYLKGEDYYKQLGLQLIEFEDLVIKDLTKGE